MTDQALPDDQNLSVLVSDVRASYIGDSAFLARPGRRVPPENFYSPSDLLTENEKNYLLAVRDWDLLTGFLVGDIANATLARAIANGKPLMDKDVYQVVSRYCGRSPRTVRYYAEVAAFYDLSARSAYETLPFSFFAYARSFSQNWETVLKFATSKPGMILAELELAFAGSGPVLPQPDQDEQNMWESPELQQFSDLVAAQNSPNGQDTENGSLQLQATPARRSALIVHYGQLIDTVDRLMADENLVLDVYTRSRVEISLAELKDCLPDILAASRLANHQG